MNAWRFTLFSTAWLFCIFPEVLNALLSTPAPTAYNEFSVMNQSVVGSSTTVSPNEDIIEKLGKVFETRLKKYIKEGVKLMMPNILKFSQDSSRISPKCTRAFMKFISDLTKVKVWALKMLDASSKLPSGLMDGTFTDYGGFDECLEIMVPLRNGSEDFRGRYCAIEAGPILPPVPKNLSLARQMRAKPFDTIATEFRISSSSLHYLRFRFGVCIPSSCSIQDIRNLVPSVVDSSWFMVHIPKCYVKESATFNAVHIAVIFVLAILVILAISGTVIESIKGGTKDSDSGLVRFLSAFSLSTNSTRLRATSKSNGELKALHGLRALSMAWVILGHTYVWTSFVRVRRLSNMQVWFNSIEFEAILNGWLSVETFFFLSGLLTCYAALQVMEKTKGRLNMPMFIIHRYLRLTPSLLLTMGLVFFLPLISSGPFWHERVDPELEACRSYWWTNLLYISNWTSLSKICVHTSWYLSADFQMFIVSLLVLLLLYRSPFGGMVALGFITAICNIIVGVLTYMFELLPAILISTGNTEEINKEIDNIHMRTFSHAGPYCIGMATGYLILKKKNTLKFTRWQNILGWCASIFLSISSLYGLHKWNTGYFNGPLLTSLYAAMHRTTFTLGFAWVTIACTTGNGGPVNWILSLDIWAPFSKLTYMAYLLHGLVLWTRYGSIRERFYLSHYNMIYEYFTNIVIVVVLSFPFYLLVEAPLNNLERMIFGKSRPSKENTERKDSNHAQEMASSTSHVTSGSVEIISVKTFPSSHVQN